MIQETQSKDSRSIMHMAAKEGHHGTLATVNFFLIVQRAVYLPRWQVHTYPNHNPQRLIVSLVITGQSPCPTRQRCIMTWRINYNTKAMYYDLSSEVQKPKVAQQRTPESRSDHNTIHMMCSGKTRSEKRHYCICPILSTSTMTVEMT